MREVIIGLEIHVELKTASKMFCSCANESDVKTPNTNVCPVCMGHPGTLPVPNREAIDKTILLGIALGSKISPHSKFDRKHYFYPDLPKGYQISQYDLPFCVGGSVTVMTPEGEYTIRLTRIHLEEDTGKLTHPGKAPYSLVDYNRAGVPLMEIVTEPDMHTPAEAKAFLQHLRQLVRYVGISDGDMEKGHVRCDANISLREQGATAYNPKTEIKNMNSFRSVEQALAYEIDRQNAAWDSGEVTTVPTTRGWDDTKKMTVLQRTKEGSADYRYFPEPDIPPIEIDAEHLRKIRASLPELPGEKSARFMKEYGLTAQDARVLTDEKTTSAFFEEVVSELQEWLRSFETSKAPVTTPQAAKLAANWIQSELFKYVAPESDVPHLKITAENFAELIALVAEKKINSSAAQTVLKTMVEHGGDPSQIVETQNLAQVSDEGAIESVCSAVIARFPDQAVQYRSGKENVIQYFVGQVMKEMKGKANPETARTVLERLLKG